LLRMLGVHQNLLGMLIVHQNLLRMLSVHQNLLPYGVVFIFSSKTSIFPWFGLKPS
jgi:hypothetical protein